MLVLFDYSNLVDKFQLDSQMFVLGDLDRDSNHCEDNGGDGDDARSMMSADLTEPRHKPLLP